MENKTTVLQVVNANDLKQSIQEVVNESIERYFATKQEDKFLTISQVAKRLNVSKPTWWRWDKEGVLKKVKIGNKVFYSLNNVNEIMEGRA